MEKYFEYLEELRQSGETNMYGAAPYLERAFPELDRKSSEKVLIAWMESFNNEGSEDE